MKFTVLGNPGKDAHLIAEKLRQLGFDVTEKLDRNLKGTTDDVDEFACKIREIRCRCSIIMPATGAREGCTRERLVAAPRCLHVNNEDYCQESFRQCGGRSGGRPSNPNVILGRALAAFIAGVEHPARLDQQQFDLVFGIRLVFDAFRDDEHFARRYLDRTVAKIDPQ
jgi:hypothetical protein